MHKCKAPKISYLEEKTCIKGDFINSEYQHLEGFFQFEFIKIDECLFKNVIFKGSSIIKSDFMDVIFENCDCSNMKFSNSSFHRVIFKSCRMIGCDFTDTYLSDVQFLSTRAQFINFSGSKIDSSLKKITIG